MADVTEIRASIGTEARPVCGGNRRETLPAAEDVKKVERRLASEEMKSLTNPDALPWGE